MTLIKRNSTWYLTTPAYSGASKDLQALIKDARILTEQITICNPYNHYAYRAKLTS